MPIYISNYSQLKEFYVYEYLRSRKSKFGDIGTPYNVGKGKGKRAFSKNRNISPPKDKKQIKFVSLKMNEADAFQLEMLLIYLYGRIDLGTGVLRNLTTGGEGVSGIIISKKTRRIQSAQRSNKVWVNNAREQHLIKSNDLLEYQNRGFSKGMLKSSVAGKIWMFNPATNKSVMISPDQKVEYITLGYTEGRPTASASVIKAIAATMSKLKTMYCAKTMHCIRILPELADSYLQKGYQFGRPFQKRNRNKIISNPIASP